MSVPREITEGDFEEVVLQSELPVLIDFWAEWCGPCKIVAPVVEELAADYDGRLVVGKVDVDKALELAGKYGIRSIPSLLIFKDGEVVDTIVGAQGKSSIAKKIDAVLSG
ncbi:MAG: thioredoxin [Armatimonadota bacterium]|jgi:thioredoxin 1